VIELGVIIAAMLLAALLGTTILLGAAWCIFRIVAILREPSNATENRNVLRIRVIEDRNADGR
jgi:hypothetical protein